MKPPPSQESEAPGTELLETRQEAGPLELPPSAEDVREAYIWLFGREVESEQTVEAHVSGPSRGALRLLLLSSEEFSNSYRDLTMAVRAGELSSAMTGASEPDGDDGVLASPAGADGFRRAHLWIFGREVETDETDPGDQTFSRRELRRRLLRSDEFYNLYASHVLQDPLGPPPSADDVRNAYVWLLGREVESKEAVRSHLSNPSRRNLRRNLLNSDEFSQSYAAGAAVDASRWVAAEVLGGRLVWLDLYDRFVSRAVLNGTWKPAETRLVRSLLRPGDGFIDAGANIGWFSMLAAEQVGRFGQVLAFEPAQNTRAHLEKSVKANGLSSRITVSPFALWDETMLGELAWNPSVYNPGHAWVNKHPAGEGSNPVQCRRLDDVADLPKLSLIKLAVEGAEFRALMGAEQTLRDRSPTVLAELNAAMLQRVSSASARDLHDFMAACGYDCHVVASGGDGDAGEPETRAASAEDLEELGVDSTHTLLFTS